MIIEVGKVEFIHFVISQPADIPVIYLVDYTDDDVLKCLKASGTYSYLLEPFSRKELCLAVEMTLHKKMLEEKVREFVSDVVDF